MFLIITQITIEDIIQKYKSSINIKFNKNKNLGFSLNAIKSVNMASGELPG